MKDVKEIINLLHYTTNIKKAIKDVQFIQASCSENYEIKKQVVS